MSVSITVNEYLNTKMKKLTVSAKEDFKKTKRIRKKIEFHKKKRERKKTVTETTIGES